MKFNKIDTAKNLILIALSILLPMLTTIMVVSEDIFFARMPTSYVFPECGNQNEFQCGYDLAVSLYKYDYDADWLSKQDATMKLLPDKLLYAAIFTEATAGETCSQHLLISELVTARKNSVAYDGFYANGLSLAATKCFAGGLVTNEFNRELVLLWQYGSVQAWMECKGHACHFNLTLENSDQALANGSISLSIRSIAANAAPSFIRNMKSVVRRVLFYSEDYYEIFADYRGDISVKAMDDSAAEIIDSWGTR